MSTPETSDALSPRPVEAPLVPPAAEAGPPARARSRLPWIVGGVVLGVLLLAGAGTAAFLLLTPASGPGPAEAVEAYDRAYAEVDCELFASVTTDAYREALAPTCADFEAEAQAFVDNFTEYDVAIGSTEIDGATATVTTTESWVLDGQENSAEYVYTLVADRGVWRIDDLD